MKVLLVNGPNLNLLGVREPQIYGKTTLQQVETSTIKILSEAGLECVPFQSNSEGEIINFLHQQKKAKHTIINPGGLTHSSVALRDALTAFAIPFIEVHITNIYQREAFRQHSVLSGAANAVICGCGTQGYKLAAQFIIQQFHSKED